MPSGPESFDHVFVCFVLEHLTRPAEALIILRRLLRPGGTITVIEGDHGSTYFHPESLQRKQNRENRPNFAAYLRGRVEFVCMVDPKQAEVLRPALAKALARG